MFQVVPKCCLSSKMLIICLSPVRTKTTSRRTAALGVSLGEKIRTLRKAHNLTQEQLGNKFHYSRTAICNYELNKRQVPFELLSAMAKYFNIDAAYFLDENYTKIKNDILIISNNRVLLDITKLPHSFRLKLVKNYFKYIKESKNLNEHLAK